VSTIITIQSVSQIHAMLGREQPEHPLVSLFETAPRQTITAQVPLVNTRFVSELYALSLKRGDECQLKYGRQLYDFQAGSLLCLAPGQAITPIAEPADLQSEGPSWTLVFHPDLIRDTALAGRVREFGFFGYDSHEALHLAAREAQTLTSTVETIREEYRQNLDEHSQQIIVDHLQLLLSYCQRFYGRQFTTRTGAHKAVLARFEQFLNDYFETDAPRTRGIPSVRECAVHLGYSPNYLSDLLRKETGKNAREHLHLFVIERAKDRLLASEQTISEIAYSLGFEYPQHFSKLFRSKTGMSPAKFRN
jgi:AraC family transcriptional regulator, transcriptional activator of pobA